MHGAQLFRRCPCTMQRALRDRQKFGIREVVRSIRSCLSGVVLDLGPENMQGEHAMATPAAAGADAGSVMCGRAAAAVAARLTVAMRAVMGM